VKLAVAVHDVEPRTYARTREIRGWLLERGITRVTLLVIPAIDLHPIGSRAPALASWLRAQVACGDAVAQHGLSHHASATPVWPRRIAARWQGDGACEFPGLRRADAARRVRVGRRLLAEIELDPGGFVAPGYAYTRALRRVLAESYGWFGELRRVWTLSHGAIRAPALCLGSSTTVKRALSPTVVRTVARAAGPLMRVDIHPADFDTPRHVATLEWLLDRATGREPVTYDQLVG
jgi:predicted deacetylase